MNREGEVSTDVYAVKIHPLLYGQYCLQQKVAFHIVDSVLA